MESIAANGDRWHEASVRREPPNPNPPPRVRCGAARRRASACQVGGGRSESGGDGSRTRFGGLFRGVVVVVGWWLLSDASRSWGGKEFGGICRRSAGSPLGLEIRWGRWARALSRKLGVVCCHLVVMDDAEGCLMMLHCYELGPWSLPLLICLC